jgi:hypothetical protein
MAAQAPPGLGLRAASLRGRSTRSDAASGKTENKGEMGGDGVHMPLIFHERRDTLNTKNPFKSTT